MPRIIRRYVDGDWVNTDEYIGSDHIQFVDFPCEIIGDNPTQLVDDTEDLIVGIDPAYPDNMAIIA